MENFSENNFENKEKEPEFQDVVIFTATLQRLDDEVSRAREIVSRKFFDNTANLGIRCVVVDGGSDESFIEYLQTLDNVKIIQVSGGTAGEQRRIALNAALEYEDANYFLYIDPEKDDFIRRETLEPLVMELRENKTDIAVARRRSKESYPKFQSWIETRANKRANKLLPEEYTDTDIDFWFGPKMFNRNGADFFTNYKGKLDKWDSHMKPILDAARAGSRISSIDVDYSVDPEQTKAEEADEKTKRKRVEQYTQILKEFGDDFWVNKT